MPNAKDFQIGRNKKIAAYGPTGSGKSALFTSIPGKKFAYIFDSAGLDTLAGLDIEYEAFYPDPLQSNVFGTPRKTTTGVVRLKDPKARKVSEKPMAYINFEDHIFELLETRFEGYDVIGFLSITTLATAILDRVQAIDNRLDSVPELSDYNIVGITMGRLFRRVLAIPNKIFYLEAHSDMVQDELTKRIYNQLDIGKRQRREIPRMLSDVWITHCDSSKDSTRYEIQTLPDRAFPIAKNSMQLENRIDVTMNLTKPREIQGLGKIFKERGI